MIIPPPYRDIMWGEWLFSERTAARAKTHLSSTGSYWSNKCDESVVLLTVTISVSPSHTHTTHAIHTLKTKHAWLYVHFLFLTPVNRNGRVERESRSWTSCIKEGWFTPTPIWFQRLNEIKTKESHTKSEMLKYFWTKLSFFFNVWNISILA